MALDIHYLLPPPEARLDLWTASPFERFHAFVFWYY